VLGESHGLIARRLGARTGLGFLSTLTGSAGPRVIWADEELTLAAIGQWLARHQERPWSLVDAVSFEVMQREGIERAFAFDQDFELAGFALL